MSDSAEHLPSLRSGKGGLLPFKPRTTVDANQPEPPPGIFKNLKGTLIVGTVIAFGFVLGGGYWSATAELSSAAVAPGVVSPLNSRRVVQHLEGGIIREIMVREGDTVEEGQILVAIQDVSAESNVDVLTSRLRSLAAEEARLLAERADAASVDFDHLTLQDRDNPSVIKILRSEQLRFQKRREVVEQEKEILIQQVDQFREQIQGQKDQLASISRQQELLSQEIKNVQTLVDKGLSPLPRLLGLKRQKAELDGTRAQLNAEIAKAEVKIGEIELQILSIDTRRQEEVENRLAEVQANRREVEGRIRESADRLSRTVIHAPAPGKVLNLNFTTPGGVVRAGEPILEIVPSEDRLVIEAKISPSDIDDVVIGQEATIVFSSLPTRQMARLTGILSNVSGDALEDKRTGERYYAGQVDVDRAELAERVPDLKLVPGIPADVFIKTGKQTVLDYLLGPLIGMFDKAFRES